MKHVIIGICGGTGSGKTTLSKKIMRSLGEENAILIAMDAYYKNQSHLSFEERKKTNYDHPKAFDIELLVRHLNDIKADKSINAPIYDFTTHSRTHEVQTLDSKPVIILEGILLFAFPELLSLLDVKIFVDTDADVRILRRISRDVNERGRTLDSVVNQYLTTVKPMHESFIEPNKKYADIIIPEGGKNNVAYEMILSLIRNFIK